MRHTSCRPVSTCLVRRNTLGLLQAQVKILKNQGISERHSASQRRFHAFPRKQCQLGACEEHTRRKEKNNAVLFCGFPERRRNEAIWRERRANARTTKFKSKKILKKLGQVRLGGLVERHLISLSTVSLSALMAACNFRVWRIASSLKENGQSWFPVLKRLSHRHTEQIATP